MSVGDGAGLVLVKLGGSLITDKRGREVFRPRVVARLAREVAEARGAAGGAVVLGHGAGSFGHAAAVRHGIGGGPLAATAAAGIAAVQDRTARLHRKMIDAFLRADIPSFSLAPSSLVVARAGRIRSLPVAPLLDAVRAGLVPVLFGDVVVDRSWGAAICSTETAFLALARAARRAGTPVARALFVGATDGVLDERGSTIRSIRVGEAGRALRSARGSHGTDVTGGMRHRLQSALELARGGTPCWIGDGSVPGRLALELARGGAPGTRVDPR